MQGQALELGDTLLDNGTGNQVRPQLFQGIRALLEHMPPPSSLTSPCQGSDLLSFLGD